MFPSLCEVSTDQLKEAVKKLLQFLHETLQISGAHTVDFYTQDIWKKLVAVSPETVLSAFSKHNGTSHHIGKEVPELSSIFSNQQLVNIEAFVEASHSHSLVNMGICTSVDELLEALAVHKAGSPDLKTDQFMNDKKLHEVLIMSQLVQSIANICGVKQESIMVGLHTCGDLAPNTLRIFTAKPEIKAVCSVGCCYHLLSEEFESPEEEITVTTWGFPMSIHLKESSWFFGRNARMSACLALERVAVGQGLATESLFYRAVLQVILKDCFSVTQSDKRVGKIFSKSGNFTEYVRKSLKKLGHDDSELSDMEIMEYFEKYKPRKNEMEAFNMLKVLLAPCIEALILLDRLLYLKEQNNLAWSGLVKLFDPVKSPRCYAVVSMKKV
eukprot:XP_017947725.1 PREDICTED: methyltransferase-like protein 25 isoform X5 [Xenopus tropicalis]